MADDRGESDPLEALTSKIDFKMNLLNDVMAEHREVKQVISGVMKEKESLQQEKERLQQEKERLLHEHLENGEALARMKEDLLSSKKTLVEARDALVSSSEVISQKDKYVEFLKKKLQESEAKNNQAEQQGGTKSIEPGGVQTGSMQKRKRPSEGPLDYDFGTNEPTSQLDDRSLSPLESLGNPNTRSIKMKRRLLSGTGQEFETLRATVHDKDEALRSAEKAHGELRDQIVGWQTHAEELEKQQREAQANATSFQALLEAEVGRNQLLQCAITTVCDSMGVEPDADTEEDVPGNSFVRRMTVLGNLVREKVRGALHHGVKRALAVVRSAYVYDMGLIADGFTVDPSNTEEENEAACLGLIEAAEEPGGRLARLFEDEVLPPTDDEGL